MQTPTIDFHPSVLESALRQEAISSLQSNRIDPKSLYATPRQAELWRRVSLRHSPVHGNPEFSRIYRDAFAKAIDRLELEKVLLVGLGCGTGFKELELYLGLKSRGREGIFSAIDVSRDLVLESVEKLTNAGAGHRRSLVCDLAQAEFLGQWLEALESGLPRLITFFGLVPNLFPSVVARLFRSVLRPGDILLASVHLAPVHNEDPEELLAAMQLVLPQYDNPETMAWLNAALELWDLESLVEQPEMKIGQVDGIPAFLSTAKWKTGEPFEKWGHPFSPKREESLRLFSSLRYTPPLFENFLYGEGFSAELLTITACRQEAIWLIRNG